MTRRILLFAVLVGLVGCGAAIKSRPTEQKQLDLDFPVGEFALTERSGAKVTDKDLRGKVWVSSFIFTRCNGPCPAVTQAMRRLQDDLAAELKGGGLKLVTFTVDPDRDDLKTLNEYADARQADKNNWLFLTGDKKTIHALCREQFKQAIEQNVGPGVKPGDEFAHSTRLFVVDKGGVIRAMYEGLADDEMPDGKERFESGLERLKVRARELLK
jgi:cytochrome oxidase Cu insertion factor (SCO1/SenC/PrrC family)